MKIRAKVAMLTICLMLVSLVAPIGAQAASTASPKYGITVDANGVFKMNGKPFYAYGVNEYTMVFNIVADPFNAPVPERIFPLLKKYDIPFIRTPLVIDGIWEKYQKNPDSAFEQMDAILAEAEKNQIGVVISIFFNLGSIETVVNEPIYKLGDPNSKMVKLLKNFARDAVKRYLNHPAVWGWEVTNEVNLVTNIMGTDKEKCYTSTEGLTFISEIAKTIREVDSYRMISSGHALLRESTYHLHQAALNMTPDRTWNMDWTADTLSQFREMNDVYTPNPVDTVSMHSATLGSTYRYELKDKKLTYAELLKEYVSVSKSLKKGFFYGEYGYFDFSTSNSYIDLFPKGLETMVDAGVQLSALWQFNHNNQLMDDEGGMGFVLKELQKVNTKFKESGLQDTAGAWPQRPPSSTTSNAMSSTQSTARPTTSVTSKVETSTTDQLALDKYMVTSSTKLTISAEDNIISIEKPVTRDIFFRSVALRTGYTMKVFDQSGAEITDDAAKVDGSAVVKVYNPDGEELRRFTVTVLNESNADTTESSQPVSDVSSDLSGDLSDNANTFWWFIVIGIVVVLGGGFALFWFVIRPKLAKKSAE